MAEVVEAAERTVAAEVVVRTRVVADHRRDIRLGDTRRARRAERLHRAVGVVVVPAADIGGIRFMVGARIRRRPRLARRELRLELRRVRRPTDSRRITIPGKRHRLEQTERRQDILQRARRQRRERRLRVRRIFRCRDEVAGTAAIILVIRIIPGSDMGLDMG